MYTVMLPDLVKQNHESEWVLIFFISRSAYPSKQHKSTIRNVPVYTKWRLLRHAVESAA